jgi:poly-gamma-glutamate synthesis protein (capsule biosynthesis protein)
MYFPSFAASTTKLLRFSMVATRTRRLRVNRASGEETAWLEATLNREGRRLGTRVELQADHSLRLHWN